MIRHEPLDLFSFPSIQGTLCTSVGCPLSCRAELSGLLAQVLEIAALNPELTPDDLLRTTPSVFGQSCDRILSLLNLSLHQVHGPGQTILPELILLYSQEGELYKSWVESLEFAYRYTKPDPDAPVPQLQKSDERFKELWFIDCQGTLCKVTEPNLFSVQRLNNLLQFLGEQSKAGFAESYDSDPIIKEIAHECLGLFGLSPDQVSSYQFTELFISANYEFRPGEYVLLPGWLQQLVSEQTSFVEDDSEPLPDNENVVDATVASLMSDRYPLDQTMEVIRGIPASQLRSILRSRSRMLKQAREDAKPENKKTPKISKATHEKLTKEFKRGIPFAMHVIGDKHNAINVIKGAGIVQQGG